MSTPNAARKVPISRLLGRFWTAANMLSLSRLILVLPITYLIWTDGPLGWTFALIGLGILTDFFDGRVARWSNTVSSWGKVLDPLADKTAAALVTMALVFREPEPNLPLWLLVVILVRDVTIVAGGILLGRRKGHVVMSVYSGKLAVNMLALTVLAALLKADAPVLNACVIASAALLVYSYVLYVFRFIRLIRAEPLPSMLEAEGAAPPVTSSSALGSSAEPVSR